MKLEVTEDERFPVIGLFEPTKPGWASYEIPKPMYQRWLKANERLAASEAEIAEHLKNTGALYNYLEYTR